MLRSGIPVRQEGNVIREAPLTGGRTENTSFLRAAFAIKNTNQRYFTHPERTGSVFAALTVEPYLKGAKEGTGKKNPAKYAGLSSWEEADQGHARANVEGFLFHDRKEPVYNLTVDECPEFYANGILVHNCDPTMDALLEMCGVGLYTLDNL